MADLLEWQMPDPLKGVTIDPGLRGKAIGASMALGGDVLDQVKGLANYVKTPGMVTSGEIPAADIPQAAQGFAAQTAMLGAGAPAPAGALRTLSWGKRVGDTGELALAEKMRAAGEHPQSIWEATGYYWDHFGNLRHEISDLGSGLDFRQMAQRVGDPTLKVGDVYKHPDLYARHPMLEQLPLNLNPDMPSSQGAMHSTPFTKKPRQMDVGVGDDDVRERLLTFIHEGTHGSQMLGGKKLPQGGHPENFLDQQYYLDKDNYDMSRGFFLHRLQELGIDPVVLAYKEFRNAVPDWPMSEHELGLLRQLGQDRDLLAWADDLVQRGDQLGKTYQEAQADYFNLSGETEARNAEERFKDPRLMQRVPPATEDRRFEKQIWSPSFWSGPTPRSLTQQVPGINWKWGQ